MPSNNVNVDGKSRQSSGGRSFFGRKINKERSQDSHSPDDGGSVLEVPSTTSSANGSRSSRYSHRSQMPSEDSGQDGDNLGLSMTAGVITSIPYDSVPSGGKTPISVDYLPKNDMSLPRKEPLPHHLGKGGKDFHQYPSFNPSEVTNGSSLIRHTIIFEALQWHSSYTRQQSQTYTNRFKHLQRFT